MTAQCVIQPNSRRLLQKGVAQYSWSCILIGSMSTPLMSIAENHIPPLIHYMLAHPLPSGTFMNVNFPKNLEMGIRGIRFTKQGKEYWAENPEQRNHPGEGLPYYWLGSKLAQFEEEEESDILHLRQGYATAVPIHIGDLTHHEHLQKHREHFEKFVNP